MREATLPAATPAERLIAPMRLAARKLRGLHRLTRQLARVAQHHGLMGTLHRAIDICHESGLRGLWRTLQSLRAASGGAGMPLAYRDWVLRYDTLDDVGRDALKQRLQSMPRLPLISVLMPTWNSNPEWLHAAIESVRRQLYPHWELCIADDASTDAGTREVLNAYRGDARIRAVRRPQNGHISAASNTALALAHGEWIALLDHDDLLKEDALFWIADCINRHPKARLIYSDEDKLAADGTRCDPYFKPDWNPDLFLSQNMFCHLGAYHASLVRQVGGFRVGLEGAQDYDLVLRCIEHVTPEQIRHVPRVLYHWRVHARSTAAELDAKPYAQVASERALNAHLARRGVRATAAWAGNGYRVRYALPDAPPRVTLIVPTRNALALLHQCVQSIRRLTHYPNYEILVIDNGSDDLATLRYLDGLRASPDTAVLRIDGAFNYSALNNAAVAQCSGELVALINNDIEIISPDWLGEMVSIALQPGVGAVGARLWYPDDTLQHGGVVLGIGGVAGHSHKGLPRGRAGYFGRADLMQSFSAVTAACLVVRRAIYLAVGGLDEVNLKIAFNDVDFCLRLQEAGLRNVWTPYAELYHHESATRGADASPEKRERFASEVTYMKQRWGIGLLRDRAYNPNLTLLAEDFSLAWPPLASADPGVRAPD